MYAALPIYDDERTEAQNLKTLFYASVAKMSDIARGSCSPFVYLLAIKHLITTGRLGLFLSKTAKSDKPVKVDLLFACKELDLLLANNAVYHHAVMTQDIFFQKLQQSLTETGLFIAFVSTGE